MSSTLKNRFIENTGLNSKLFITYKMFMLSILSLSIIQAESVGNTVVTGLYVVE